MSRPLLRLLQNIPILCLLAACASPTPFAAATTAPSNSAAYIGGVFISNAGGHISGLVLTNTQSGAEFTIAFASERPKIERHTETGIISVPAGRYRVKQWVVFAAFGREIIIRQKVDSGPLVYDFDVSPGTILLLGKLYSENAWYPGMFSSKTQSVLVVEPMSATEARATFLAKYPQFDNYRVACLLCK